MKEWLAGQIQNIFQLARNDDRYAEMQIQYNNKEEQISDWLQSQPEDIQDIFWEFICLSNAMNWRILELVLGGFPLRDDSVDQE